MLVHAAAVGGIHVLGSAEPAIRRGGSAERELRRRFDGAPVVVPALVLIGDDFAIRIGCGTYLADVGRTVEVPAMLVPAHELQAYRLAASCESMCCGLRRVVVATMAICAGAFVILDANFRGRQAEYSGQRVARGVNILRRADHERGIGFDVGERAVGPEGRVRLVRRVILPGQHARAARKRTLHRRVRGPRGPSVFSARIAA